jgi:hypothetical protein
MHLASCAGPVELPRPARPRHAEDFLADFNRWVHDRYQVTTSQGWAKIIEFYSTTEMDETALI